MTEVTTTETVLTAEQEAKNKRHSAAVTFVGSHSIADVIEHIEYQYELVEAARDARIRTAGRLEELISTVTDFIKENISDGADSDDLKQLARELEIELTKTIQVEMTVKYYADVIVPLDFDNDSLDETDFDVEISFCNNIDDVEIDHDSTEVDEFEVREV